MNVVRSTYGSSLPDTPAYSGHSVYLFSTLDDPLEVSLKTRTPSPILSPNSVQWKTGDDAPQDDHMSGDSLSTTDEDVPRDREDMRMDESGDQEEIMEEDEEEDDVETKYSGVPLILPQRSFQGISNSRTIKDGKPLTTF